MKKNDNDRFPADQLLREEAYQFMLNGTIPADADYAKKLEVLKHCLQKNAIWYKDGGVWTPPANAKFTFFHSMKDEVVPISNMKSFGSKWGWDNANCKYIKYDTETYKHCDVGTVSFAWYYDDYVCEIYRNKWKAANIHFQGELGFNF